MVRWIMMTQKVQEKKEANNKYGDGGFRGSDPTGT